MTFFLFFPSFVLVSRDNSKFQILYLVMKKKVGGFSSSRMKSETIKYIFFGDIKVAVNWFKFVSTSKVESIDRARNGLVDEKLPKAKVILKAFKNYGLQKGKVVKKVSPKFWFPNEILSTALDGTL